MPFPGFKLTDAYRFAAENGLENEAREIRSMRTHPQFSKRTHVPRKGAFVELFEKKSLMDEFVRHHWATRHTPSGELRRQSYLEGKAANERALNGEIDEDEASGDAVSDDNGNPLENDLAAFALEAHLRDFIIENLSQIAVSGTKLQLYVNSDGRSGKEYPTDVGPIDILAVDSSGSFFVFELKLDRGPDRALGQLARYMGWVKTHLAGDRETRGVVVARSIDEKLRYAACVIPNVTLLEYEIQFKLRDARLIPTKVPESSANSMERQN